MQEIGSEFWDVPINGEANDLFSNSTQWFLSGRSALKAIIKELKHCHTVSLPSWCCDSMIKPFADAGIKVIFYPIFSEFETVQRIISSADSILIMDYFGYSSLNYNLEGYKGIVIRDLTHSLFSSKYDDANYYFGSLRKWCGIWTGGYAWTKDGHRLPENCVSADNYISLRKEAMEKKNKYINGQGEVDKSYLNLFEKAEEELEKLDVVSAANRDIVLARKIDVEFIKKKRRENAEVLRNAFPEWLIFSEMGESDCPMFVPILVPDGRRNELRKYLIKKEIYCPVHWPISEYHQLDENTKELYLNELSLVCDQRYSKEDMIRMIDAIKDFWKEK